MRVRATIGVGIVVLALIGILYLSVNRPVGYGYDGLVVSLDTTLQVHSVTMSESGLRVRWEKTDTGWNIVLLEPIKLDTIVLTNGYSGKRRTFRFVVDSQHYHEAYHVCVILMIPYEALADTQKKYLFKFAKYVKHMEEITR